MTTGVTITSKFAQAGALRIHYSEAGEGPALICLHGGGPGASGLSNYSRNIDALATHFRVILVDMPGYGESDKPAIKTELRSFLAESLCQFMDAIGLDRAHFVGNSLGGGTAMQLAVDHPERVDRLVLMGPAGGLPIFTALPTEGIRALREFYEPPGPSPERFLAFLKCMVYDASALTDELVSARYAEATRPGFAENFPLRASNMRPMHKVWSNLNAVKAKTLLIWGRDDRTNTLDGSFIILNQIPDVQLHVFSQCGHWAQWEKASEFNRLLIDFLSPD